MLQERISNLGSGILQIKDNKIYVIGFMSPERLDDYYNRNIDCHFSQGIYPYTELNWGTVQDNALFLILDENNTVIKKYQFLVIKEGSIKVKYKNENNLTSVKTKSYKIRKCKFTNLYNIVIKEILTINGKKTTVKECKLFNSLDELKEFFVTTFGKELKCNEI